MPAKKASSKKGRAKGGRAKKVGRAKSSGAAADLPRAVFRSVAIVVSDRERSLAWYTEKLGLDAIDRMDHWITVGRAGEPAVLHLCQTSDYDTTIPPEQGNTGIRLALPGDFADACARLAANGVTFSEPATKSEWGWWATIVDPDGNEIALTALD